MTLKLEDYESGNRYASDYADDLAALQERVSRQLVSLNVHGKRAIIVAEGWDAAGKGGAIQRLTAKCDPRHFKVWPIAAPTPEERAHHYLWRFWQRLPRDGELAIFDRSWYGRVLVERVEGLASEAEWRRGYDEINAFEASQDFAGTKIVKLFFHVTAATQDERLAARLNDPWKRWKVTAEDFRNRDRRADYLAAIQEMFARTDTACARWTVIDGNDKKAARIAALEAVADALSTHVPTEPPGIDAERAHAGAAFLGGLGKR